MTITATELKLNLGKYLKLAEKEDVFITRNGKVTTKLSNPNQSRIDAVKALRGILPADITLEESRLPVYSPAESLQIVEAEQDLETDKK